MASGENPSSSGRETGLGGGLKFCIGLAQNGDRGTDVKHQEKQH